jgi:hypothetical protein
VTMEPRGTLAEATIAETIVRDQTWLTGTKT